MHYNIKCYDKLFITRFKEEWYKVYPLFVSFLAKNFIIIKNKSFYFQPKKLVNRRDKIKYKKAIDIVQDFNIKQRFGYEIFTENDFFFIWRKKE